LKISINNCDSKVHTGFGHATLKLLSNIPKTGHSVLMNRASQFEMTFAHPPFYNFKNPDAYKIGYTAWESTEIKREWLDYLDLIDELWVPNNFCKSVFEQYIDKPIYVFHHGVDERFSPKKRVNDGTLKFIHMGYPAFRKNLHETIEAFLELYQGREDVTLTIKSYGGYDVPQINEPNINVIEKTTTYDELIKIMHEHDVLLYPSWGEGFGLIPLQALATGMPVILTSGWADYDYYMPDLNIKSKLTYNPWQQTHPGKMFKPDFEDFKNKIKYAEENIEMLFDRHYNSALDIHKNWSWEKVVKDHFDSVEARLMV
jgi:glycosyltransferase involved in cell wall biosynthesis